MNKKHYLFWFKTSVGKFHYAVRSFGSSAWVSEARTELPKWCASFNDYYANTTGFGMGLQEVEAVPASRKELDALWETVKKTIIKNLK